jgi:hypothetical protein
MRKRYVTFVSPGTFVSETTTKPILSYDVVAAVEMSRAVTERYGAKPFAFYFSTQLVADPVPDGEGGWLDVEAKEVEKSGNYFVGGTLLTLDDLKARNDPKNSILISNMECNGWPIVVENRNSYLSVQPFGENDFIVSPDDGRVIESGNDLAYRAYRRRKIEEHKIEMERYAAQYAKAK